MQIASSDRARRGCDVDLTQHDRPAERLLDNSRPTMAFLSLSLAISLSPHQPFIVRPSQSDHTTVI